VVLLEIYCSLQQLKNFANRSRIDKVIAMVRVAPFLTHGVQVEYTYSNAYKTDEIIVLQFTGQPV